MGAWGVGPLANDRALDWISSRVDEPLAEAIETTLQRYLDAQDGSWEDEACAAAALLVDCTSPEKQLPYRTIDLCYQADNNGWWDLAILVVDKLMQDEESLRRWKDPEGRSNALAGLKLHLEQAREASTKSE